MQSPRSLAERRGQLLTLCAAERARATAALGAFSREIGVIDRGLRVAGRWARNPAVIAVAVALFIAVARSRRLRTSGALLSLLATGVRIFGVKDSIRRWRNALTRVA